MYYLLLALAVVILLFYKYITWNDDFWMKRGVPHEEPKFFFGNIKDQFTGKQHYGQICQEMYNNYNDNVSYLGFMKLLQPSLLLRDPDLVKDVLSNEFSSFSNTEFQLSGKYTTDVIAKAVFGVDNNTFEDEHSLFYRITTSFFGSSFLDNIKLYIVILIPKLASTLRIRFVNKEVQDKIIKITKDIISQRQQFDIKRNDFFQQMINYRENDIHNEFTDIYIASHAFEFILDGYETSSIAISYVLHELAWNQDIQNQLREEINASMKETNGLLSFEHLHAMKYLDRVVSESLRIHPPGLVITRVCTKDFEFPPPKPGGKPMKMEVGSLVTIPVYALHMDPKYFPEPEKFNPDNFTEEAIASRHKFVYLPFGEGPRVCPGSRFALTQSKAAIVSIVNNFKIKPSSKSPYPTEIDPNMFLIKPKKDTWIHLEEIKK